jgi:hypothetical protein
VADFTPSTVVWESVWRISGKCTPTFIQPPLANVVTVASGDEVTHTSSSFYESASSPSSYTSAFLQLRGHEESRHLSLTSAAEWYIPVPDAIHKQMQWQLPLLFLLNVYNWIRNEGFFISNWREAIVVPNLKAGKDRPLPSSYLPIFWKLLKRMVIPGYFWYWEAKAPIGIALQLSVPLSLDGPSLNAEETSKVDLLN